MGRATETTAEVTHCPSPHLLKLQEDQGTFPSLLQSSPSALGTDLHSTSTLSLLWSIGSFWNSTTPPSLLHFLGSCHIPTCLLWGWWAVWLSRHWFQDGNHRRSPAPEKQLMQNTRIPICHIHKSPQLTFVSPSNWCLRSAKLFQCPFFTHM